MPLIKPSGVAFEARSKEVEASSREHLEPVELKALWGALAGDVFWLGYFKAQYHWGCRCSEVAIMLKEDVSFLHGRIFIRRLKKRTEEGFRVREYELPVKLSKTLQAVQAFVPADNPWFFGSRVKASGKKRKVRMADIRITEGGWRSVSRSTAQKRFVKAAEAAELPDHLRHTHVLRHTRATLLFANGASEGDVQVLLDHSSATTTRKYIGWAKALQKRADITAMLGDVE